MTRSADAASDGAEPTRGAASDGAEPTRGAASDGAEPTRGAASDGAEPAHGAASDGAEPTHVPVMLERVAQLLVPALSRRGAVCVDATLGLGGHTEALLRAAPEVTVVGIDRDPHAVSRASQRLAEFGNRFRPVQAVYDEIPQVLGGLGMQHADAVLFDLGVSSMQLDQAERGFAYRVDAPLDMRMDSQGPLTAADVLNTYEAADLERILREYGEERYARRIAREIVRRRATDPFRSSAALVELLHRAIPQASQKGGHPAKRTFQALRIEVNEELRVLEHALPAAIDSLEVGGRVAVLGYHSLEDRMVKRVFAAGSRDTTPPGLPVELPEHAAYLRLLTRGAERPSEAEVAANPRAGSARLRAAEKTRTTRGGSG